MADKKISQLTAATTPLAGSEVLPIVQSSTTVKVSVADVTKGRTIQTTGINDNNNNEAITITTTASAVNEITVANAATGANPVIAATGSDTNIGITLTPKGTGDAVLTSGNLVPNTAAKGLNFTANTPAAGMTSQLLNWYEDGDWIPTITCGTSGTITLNIINTLSYTRIGKLMFIGGLLQVGSVASPVGELRVSLPFTVSNRAYLGQGSTSSGSVQISGSVSKNLNSFVITASANNSYAIVSLGDSSSGGNAAGEIKASTYIIIGLTYLAA